MKRLKYPIFMMTMLILALFPSRAVGVLIEFTFGGQLEFVTVTGTPTGPWADNTVGDPFSVVYMFDSEAVDQETSPGFGIYEVLSLSVTIDGIALEAGFAEIEVDVFLPPFSRYLVFFEGFSFPTSGTINLSTFFLLDTDALLTDINLDDWDHSFFDMGTEFSEFGGEPTTFSSRVVPGPGGLFLPALLLIFFNGRRRRKITS